VYIVSFIAGDLHLVGRLTVDRIVTEAEAYAVLQPDYELWEADEHVISTPGSGTEIHFKLMVPPGQVDAIEFVDANGSFTPPRRNRHDAVDPQTFRGVREISPVTAAAFDRLLGAATGRPDCMRSQPITRSIIF
jgi:hypothetical protein